MLLRILHNANTKWDWFVDSRALSLPLAFGAIKKAILQTKARGTRFRFITEITKENMTLTKEFRDILEFKHLEEVKGNFAVSYVEYIAISTTMNAHLGDSKSITRATIPHAVYSNVIEVTWQQQCIFEVLWNKGRIKEIEGRIQDVSTSILEDEDKIITELRRLNSS